MSLKFLSVGICCFMVGCGTPGISTGSGTDTEESPPPEQKFPYGLPLVEGDETYFDFDPDKQTLELKDDLKKQDVVFFEKLDLSPDKLQEQLQEKRVTFYYRTSDKGVKRKLSVPFKLFTSTQPLCIHLSQNQEWCTDKEVKVTDIVKSQEKPLMMTVTNTKEKNRQSEGGYKLIVISLSYKFKPAEQTAIKSGLETFLQQEKTESDNNDRYPAIFRVLVIGSGREISEVLTAESLHKYKPSGQGSILETIRHKVQFNAQDLRAIDDLELVEDEINNYERGGKTIASVLYVTANDRIDGDRKIPRSQCIPLAWHRDHIQLNIITNQTCEIWKNQAQVKQCVEWEKDISSNPVNQLTEKLKKFIYYNHLNHNPGGHS
jgi:hypothetical protein